ncbi:capping protein-inhibiting regulator of actin dynamics [Lepus europaeus]|uniref:capping protein-inhibiting regulator of actin dynamics n=1 Tax=Lepus europaeus TaxID=9983 RepID=UPI002B478543|nr:capping protein-inhibiting regulator of actin dynamics [Lepus europaeus]
MGSRAFSHDSIFIPDGGAESEQTVQAMSQDNILGKVQTLQQQLGKNIKFGQRPANALPVRKADGGEASLEEGPLLPRPMETPTPQDVVLSDTENKAGHTPGSPGAVNPPGGGSNMEEKVAPVKPSRPKRHFSSAGTIESVNLDAIPLAIARLDNSAAKHKLAVKPKNQRVSKKHRRLARETPDERDGLESEPGRQQNGHPGEEQHTWLPGSEQQQRHQEDYWRELEAKCKRQKAEAAEKRRLEEQRLQALERRLWEENRRQELWEEEGEAAEGWAERLQLAAEPRQPGPAQPEEGEGPAELETQRRQEANRLQLREQEELEAERLRLQEEEARWLEQLRQQEELEAQRNEAERLRLQEEEARRLEQLRQRQELEAQRNEAERLRLEQLRQREELEAERLQLQKEEARRLEQLRQQEELEAQRRREAERLQLQEEEAKRLEQLRQKEELEAQRRREAEKQQQLQEEEAKRLEQLKQQEELEAQRRQEAKRLQLQEEARRLEQLTQEEQLEAQRRREAEKQQLQEEARRLEQLGQQEEPEADREPGEAPPRPEEERPPQPEDSGGPRSLRGDLGEKREEGENPEERKPEAEPPNQRPRGSPGSRSEEERAQVREPRAAVHLEGAAGEAEAAAPEKGRRVEELRWQEVDERQSMPRPYTFQVSSGGRQILFPKVNLSPVTPARDTGLSLAPQEPRAPPASRALPAALSVPHTAILVTGAQLCGPAVNLSQIKDSACKSLLGLSEDRKHGDVAPGDPRQGSAKTRPSQERPGSGAALAEWASIRSRILRASEGDREPARPGDEAPRGSLRRPAPPGAKFSIKPAWQKFSDGGADGPRPSVEAESTRKKPAPGPPPAAAAAAPEPRRSPEEPAAPPEPADATEGCKFAKDLPSFLVPSPPYPGLKAAAHAEAAATWSSEAARDVAKPEPATPAGEEKASPFGIKLRRTNYSLRFHCDQQAEQKKKKRRSSTGDGAEGAQPAAPSPGADAEAQGAALQRGPAQPPERKPAQVARREAAGSHPAPETQAGAPPAPEQDKAATRMPLAQKPALAPKPASQTPPSSPRSKLSRPYLVELLARRAGRPEPEPRAPSQEGQESSDHRPPSPPPPDERKGPKREEEEEGAPQRNPASPPALAAPQEQLSQAPEAGRREKPVLQSRHSLEGPRLAEKADTAQPLWITLALQKQKGFREQQATREERKQAREAKQAAKLSKENVSGSPQPGSSGISRAGSLHMSTTPPDENKPETAVSRLERREQLKKASTLPTSVTVEISDAAPPAPLVKEVTKRFSTPDATPVSTEPAWLALAKRKAKAWSDCPQIIK